MRKLTYWLVGLLLIGIATLAVLLLNNIQEITWQAAENAVCEATVADQGGVDINSAFRFTFEGDVSANAVRRYLTVEPAVELNFHQGLQAREVLAVPVEPLQPGAVYRFCLGTEQADLCWAFQTKREWRVQSASPAHASIAVSAAAVPEIYFNQSLTVDLAALPDYLQISPAIDVRFEQAGNCLRLIPDQPLAAETVYRLRLTAGLPVAGSDLTLSADFEFAFETASADGAAPDSLWWVEADAQSFLPARAPSFTCDLGIKNITPQQALDLWPEVESGQLAVQTEGPKITLSLYRYADAAAYAADLLARQQYAPLWSMQGRYPHGAATESLTWLALHEATPQRLPRGDYSFSWPTALPPGCYLLKAIYQGQARELRFQVSGLTALVLPAEGQSLIWAHHAAGGLPAEDCVVTYINGGQEERTDSDGLARMTLDHQLTPFDADGAALTRQDIYLLRLGEQELVLYDIGLVNAADAASTAAADIWQYLCLSQQNYQSGDTLEFWGYMRRRDNSDWDWGRVSVYVCAKDAPDRPVAQGYAPLANNMFRGSVDLPRLLAGEYELQIWQSGQMLLAKSFTVDMAVIGSSDGPTQIYTRTGGDDFRLSADKDAYTPGEGYTLKPEVAPASGPVLFVKSGGGLKEAAIEPEALHYGVFGLEDYGGAYWQAVSFNGEHYQVTPPLSLKADSSVYALQIELKSEKPANRGGGETKISFTLRDVAGAAPTKAGLLALVAPPGLAWDDILPALYAPNRLSGLSLWPEPTAMLAGMPRPLPSSAAEQQALFFDTLELDKNGRAELSLSLPPGEWQVYAWAVADAALPLAGSASLTLGAGERPAAPAPAAPAAETASYLAWTTRYDLEAGNSHLIREGLLFFSSTERVQAMELLWPPLFSANDTAEQRLGNAYARLLWQSCGYTEFALPQDVDLSALSACQQADGGIVTPKQGYSGLMLSMLAVAPIREGLNAFDAAALARYLESRAAGGAGSEDRAIALAGLAALGQPVLQELKLLLAGARETPLARACLIWGMAQAGDRQTAKSAFHDFLESYATDATSGSFYLEGGQGENILLSRMVAILSAACGESHTAFALMQYLQNQQEYDDLTAALTAGELLALLYANPAAASLSIFLAPAAGESFSADGRLYHIEIAARDDMWLDQPVSGNLLVESAEGDLALTCLRYLRSDDGGRKTENLWGAPSPERRD